MILPDAFDHAHARVELTEQTATVPRALWDAMCEARERERKPAPTTRPVAKGCNLHADCDAADAAAIAKGGKRAVHCSVEDCEDCFGC